MIERTDRVPGDSIRFNSNDTDCRLGQKEVGKKVAREKKREMRRKKEMQRETERVAMDEKTAAHRRHIIARLAAARSEKAREERKKAVAMTVSKHLEMEKERVRADAVGASLVAEEEAEQKRMAEKAKKVQPKKKKTKKGKEMKRKAPKKVRLLRIFMRLLACLNALHQYIHDIQN